MYANVTRGGGADCYSTLQASPPRARRTTTLSVRAFGKVERSARRRLLPLQPSRVRSLVAGWLVMLGASGILVGAFALMLGGLASMAAGALLIAEAPARTRYPTDVVR